MTLRRLRHQLHALRPPGTAPVRTTARAAHPAVPDAAAAAPAAGAPKFAEVPAVAELVHMTEAEKYLFDLQGFVVLRQVVPPECIRAANAALDRFEALAPPVGTGGTDAASTAAGGLPAPCVLGDVRTESNLYISNVLEGDPAAFARFMEVPEVLGVISDTAGGSWRLNHVYSICRWAGGQTGLHGAGHPVNLKTSYRCENGQIVSALTKVQIAVGRRKAEPFRRRLY